MFSCEIIQECDYIPQHHEINNLKMATPGWSVGHCAGTSLVIVVGIGMYSCIPECFDIYENNFFLGGGYSSIRGFGNRQILHN